MQDLKPILKKTLLTEKNKRKTQKRLIGSIHRAVKDVKNLLLAHAKHK